MPAAHDTDIADSMIMVPEIFFKIESDLGFLSFLLLQMFLTEKDKVVVVTRIVYFFE